KIEWQTPWMRTWYALPKEARRMIAEMGRIRYAPEHQRDEVRLAELEAEYEKKFGPRERAPYVEGIRFALDAPSRSFTRQEIAAMDDAEYAENRQAIAEALRHGKIDDESGAPDSADQTGGPRSW